MGEGFKNWLELVFSTQPVRLFFRFPLSIMHWLVVGEDCCVGRVIEMRIKKMETLLNIQKLLSP